jgi:hypothetical protein
MTAEQQEDENLSGSESGQNDLLKSVGDLSDGSLSEERTDYWKKEVVTVPEETLSAEKIADDIQSRIWIRENEMEFPLLEDEDQIDAKKKELSKRR